MGLFSTLFRRGNRERELAEVQGRITALRREIEQLEHTLAIPVTAEQGVEAIQLHELRELVVGEQIADREQQLVLLEQREASLTAERGLFGRTRRRRARGAAAEAALADESEQPSDAIGLPSPTEESSPTGEGPAIALGEAAPVEEAPAIALGEPAAAEEEPAIAMGAPAGEVEPEPAAEVPARAGEGPLPVPGTVGMEWLGWSFYRFTSPEGKVVITNPWIGNPDSPLSVEQLTRVDIILLSGGPGDQVRDAIQIARQSGAVIVSPGFGRTRTGLDAALPLDQVVDDLQPGDRVAIRGITVRTVTSTYASPSAAGANGSTDSGPAVGFVVTFETGWTMYFAGSTAAHPGQYLVGEMYHPDIAILPMNANHDPLDFATQVKMLLIGNPHMASVYPHQHRAAPTEGETTVSEAQAALDRGKLDMAIVSPVLGQAYSFSRQES